MSRVLYVSYTGMLEPLGQSQVLQYLFRLAKEHEITLLSFEKAVHLKDFAAIDKTRELIEGNGVNWKPVKYHKKPRVLASVYDIVVMLVTLVRLQVQHKFELVHCRSYMAGISGLFLKWGFGTKFLFDMRGFWPDERVDGGIWKKGSLVYRLAKGLEKYLLSCADHVVSLTHAGIREIKRFPYIDNESFKYSVIPTCTNLDTFKPTESPEPISQTLTVGMVGSVGSWYLFDEMLQCFKHIASYSPDIGSSETKLLILNKSDHRFIRGKLEQHNIPENQVEILAADYAEVAMHMSRMDMGLFFIKPVFSKQASAPTKLGEFLGCGIPCLSNAGVGDMDEILEPTQTGVCVKQFDSESYRNAYTRIQTIIDSSDVKERCRKTSERFFSLEQGAQKYADIYRDILK